MSEEIRPGQVGKFYTSSRKIQELVGKLPDGSYIWGGPYTVPQAVSGLLAFMLLFFTRRLGLWGWNWLSDAIVIVAFSLGIVYLVGFIPAPKRSILGLLTGFVKVLFAPVTGVWRGRPAGEQTRRVRKIQRVRNNEIKTQARAARKSAKAIPAAKTATAARAWQQKVAPIAAPTSSPAQISCGLDRLLAEQHVKS